MWSDLEYMDRKRIFTMNDRTHPSRGMNQFIEDENIHFVPLLDVGISTADKEAVDSGKAMNVFFKKPTNPDMLYTAEVWPGPVHFVDFLHPNATFYWQQ